MCMADDRNESTMVDIIEQYVAFGSNIYWQKWGSELRFGDHGICVMLKIMPILHDGLCIYSKFFLFLLV